MDSTGQTTLRTVVHIELWKMNQQRIQEFVKRGIDTFQILAGSDRDCPACCALSGKIFTAQSSPILPPENCICQPHCTCILTGIAKEITR